MTSLLPKTLYILFDLNLFFFFNLVTYSTVFYGEYKCYGAGAVTSQRVEWSRNLSGEEAAPFLTKSLIGGEDWMRPVPTHFKKASTSISTTVNGNN